jgi:hypothetical protein
MLELKAFMFKSLLCLDVGLQQFHISNFIKFLDFFLLFFSLIGALSCILPVYLGCDPLHFLVRMIYFYIYKIQTP